MASALTFTTLEEFQRLPCNRSSTSCRPGYNVASIALFPPAESSATDIGKSHNRGTGLEASLRMLTGVAQQRLCTFRCHCSERQMPLRETRPEPARPARAGLTCANRVSLPALIGIGAPKCYEPCLKQFLTVDDDSACDDGRNSNFRRASR